jgi:hypothetical protein
MGYFRSFAKSSIFPQAGTNQKERSTVEKPVDQHRNADENESNIQQGVVLAHVTTGEDPEDGPNDNDGNYSRYNVDMHGDKCLGPKILFSALFRFF